MVAGDIKPIKDEWPTYYEACNHPNPELQKKWQEATWMEFGNMNKQ